MQPQTFIFFGRSGSGKGTQAKLLKEHLNKNTNRETLYLETGKEFRSFMDSGSYTGRRIKSVIESGGLAPAFLPVWIWTNVFIENFTGEEHLILDGLSRRPNEAPVLDSAITFYEREYPFIVYIDVSYDKAFEMMKGRGRADDTEDKIKQRLSWFEKDVMPAMEYFKNNDKYIFLTINGEQSIESVHKEIISKISKSKLQ